MSETAAQPTPKPTRTGRWIAKRRVWLAIGIAVFEGIIVAFAKDFSSWTVIVISVPIIAFYLFAGRSLESQTGRDISWIAAASQAFTVILCVVALLIGPLTLILAGVFAVVALILLLGERSTKSSKQS